MTLIIMPRKLELYYDDVAALYLVCCMYVDICIGDHQVRHPTSIIWRREGEEDVIKKEASLYVRSSFIHSFIHSIATDSSAFPRAVVSTQSVSSIAPVP